MSAMTYAEFLAGKAQIAPSSGLDCEPDEVHPVLKPHQRDAVAWAVRGGRRALFESFGLGKSIQQLEIERLILAKLGGGRGLIVCPLGIRHLRNAGTGTLGEVRRALAAHGLSLAGESAEVTG